MKQSACSLAEYFDRPADNRTVAFGIRILASAIIFNVSQKGTSGLFAIGVPGTLDRMLTGSDYGCGFMVASVWSIESRSSTLSPRPMMPPLQTVTFVFRMLSI